MVELWLHFYPALWKHDKISVRVVGINMIYLKLNVF